VLYDPWSHGNLFWLDAAGKVVRQEHVTLAHGTPQWMSPRAEHLLAATVATSESGAILAGLGFFTWQPVDAPPFSTVWSEWCPALPCGRRHQLGAGRLPASAPSQIRLAVDLGWTALVLVFGLRLAGYLAHRPWPALLPCPHWRRARAARFGRRASLRAGFPAPAPKGIEVFA